MLTTALLVFAAAQLYFGVGRFIGGKKWKIGQEGKRGIGMLALFPLSHFADQKPNGLVFEDGNTSKKTYSLIYSLVWPVILVWPVMALAGIATGKIVKNILDPVDLFKTVFLRFKEQGPALMESTAPSELPQSDLKSLREELVKDIAVLKELETRIARHREQIFLEEGRVDGNYRQAALSEGESGSLLKEVKETLGIK